MQPETSADKVKAKNTRRTTCIWGTVACAGCLVPLLLLIAILYPVFERARLQAIKISCQSNMKQMALAVMMYAEDNNGCLPPANRWMGVTRRYARYKSIYRCPAVSGGSQAQSGNLGYSFNPNCSHRNINTIQNPRGMPMIFDSTDLAWNAHSSLKSLPNPGRHIGGNNIGFVDGHVDWVSDSESGQYIHPSKHKTRR